MAAATVPAPAAGSASSVSAPNATAAPPAGASGGGNVLSAHGPNRPIGWPKWQEVAERVQHRDGSVRTSPPFKNGGTATQSSPPRPRAPGALGLPHPLNKATLSGAGCSSRTGSSRGGSSGKSSRSSSRDPMARDGDVSSRCSSGGGWDTSTQSSDPSRPQTPPDILAAVPGDDNGALLMPDPIRIRTMPMLDPEALDDEQCINPLGGKVEVPSIFQVDPSGPPSWSRVQGPAVQDEESAAHVVERPSMPLKRDPYDRDGTRRSEGKPEWSVLPLAKYLRGVAAQIDANLQKHGSPPAEKLDEFVSKLVAHSQKQARHAPRRVRDILQNLFSSRFAKFWNFVRNEKIRSATPEELKAALIALADALQELSEPRVATRRGQPRIDRPIR
mmetsp:Transcript_44260/g.95323  ORF Transcript_44260/g.95323 Transcript_44260/m.95323 type:complete len:388 (-) Transcript_44260:201-1364(-)|eukprot:CAMPEP_0206613416 /NCGR_PEP_ID=MMETSP0325_2-20121206/56688_1 /ASSEMBLY_ACC=CAM_ASM_000347 /TAXON_ID=2866 /ORGANISM="Crypthecodinium cohnii, Strain Seligo" /LENGTH=387 /DNA_ID=CAMNT_0054133527 /DNA_START=430 /DNA_END=1593 /DNA_ORIENTATION=-